MAYSSQIDFDTLKSFLDAKVQQYNTVDFIVDDPISIPHQFAKKQDIEIIGFLTALIAWGKREMILKSGEKLIQLMEESPYQFVQNYESGMLPKKCFVHRTFNTIDLDFILTALSNCYAKHNSLEQLFCLKTKQQGVQYRIHNFRTEFLATPHNKRSEKHLANPLKGSAAKRINMFLRWMVRNDSAGVDFGLWKTISSKELCIPLDVHTGNIARKLGLLNRNQNDWKAVEELMGTLRKMDNIDPCKYDFALFGLGVYQDL